MAEQTEKQFDADLFNSQRGVAVRLGWSSYHTLRSKGSKAGYPDRTLWRDRVIFAELKAEKGKPTDLQAATLTSLAKAGAEVYLWRPSDIDEIAQILGRRWALAASGDPYLSAVGFAYLHPNSTWLASGQRRDET